MLSWADLEQWIKDLPEEVKDQQAIIFDEGFCELYTLTTDMEPTPRIVTDDIYEED